MKVDYIIVQAGGKGTRMEYLTANKPKALVPVGNLPMLFHLFEKFPNSQYIIIGDYKKEVFKEYLRCFAEVKYIFVEADGTGTCGGLGDALSFLPTGEPFMYIWSDLMLSDNFAMPDVCGNYVGISVDFECRWSYASGLFCEKKSDKDGVAGVFLFENKDLIIDVPVSGEFVKYLQGKNIAFERFLLCGTKEIGLLSEYKKLKTEKCRQFNVVEEGNNYVVKKGINAQGRKLAEIESAWYKRASECGYVNIPYIYCFSPLKMERIDGNNIYAYSDLADKDKRDLLKHIIKDLSALHRLGGAECDMFSVHEAYVGKTFKRLDKIRDLVPFAKEKHIDINGRKCRNVFFYKSEMERQIMSYKYNAFAFIHGDCTFSNIMLKNGKQPIMIDPRGYFGFGKFYGDEDYDWAKLYYSIKGNYDRFNLKQFRLTITEHDVNVAIDSSGFEYLEDFFFGLLPNVNVEKIKLLHAIIWLSLTTYAWQDYDSVCGAFYMGCYYLEEVLYV